MADDSTELEKRDTIAAVATPAGRGGVGIVRLSGPSARRIGEQITAHRLQPRYAHYVEFLQSSAGESRVIDQGIGLFFQAPHSFTGEDVVELQGHGGPMVMDLLLREAISLGAVLARPGQFAERAFLNDKIDLTQAEAIADLIESSSEEAARSAVHSLQGEFSRRISQLVERMTALRVYVEAAIDFPEEEIDFIGESQVAADLVTLLADTEQVIGEAQQGRLLKEGMSVVIAGKPNAGKSSLLNALARHDRAIVSDVAGTTRDVLREHIHIDGMPLHIIDTAGLRDQADQVEQIGIARAWDEIRDADRVLLVSDSCASEEKVAEELWPEFVSRLGDTAHLTLIRNKCDQSGLPAAIEESSDSVCITLSATTGAGVDKLRQHLKHLMGYSESEGRFTARRRHLDALQRAKASLLQGQEQLQGAGAAELLADDLLRAQRALGEITGEYRADDLLGEIFAGFCIGK